MQHLKDVLNTLETLKPYRPPASLTKLERVMERISRYGLIASAVPFTVLAILAAWHKWIAHLSGAWITVALASAALSQLLALLSLLCPPVLLICTVWMWKERSRLLRDGEIDHEQAQLAQLERFDATDLQAAKLHLEVKIKRLERRLGYFIDADGKKMAAFSLLVLNFTVGNIFMKGDWSSVLATDFNSPVSSQIVMMLLALLLGVSIGAMCVRFITNRESYRIELLDAALLRRAGS